MRLSIIVLVFNEEPSIREDILSIKKNILDSFKNSELIIVEDYSPDRSYEICKEFESDKIRILRGQKRLGYRPSLNLGINNSSFLLLRLLRVFRVLRLISVVPELKKIIEALLSSVTRVFYVGLLLFIILYIYATIGSILYSTYIPERWGDVGVAMITLFQVLTLSSWEQVMLPLQSVYWWAWIYFFSFIIICGITMLNLLIAILVDVVINQKKI